MKRKRWPGQRPSHRMNGALTFLLLIFLTAACQPAATQVPTAAAAIPTATPTLVEPAAARTPAPPSPTPIAVRWTPTFTWTPTPSPEPFATIPAAPLSAAGPWLVYHYRTQFMETAEDSFELGLVNADGSGHALIRVNNCDYDIPLNIAGSPNNRLAELRGNIYLLQPEQAAAKLVHYPIYNTCLSEYRGSSEEGLLASIDQTNPTDPLLRVYKLPEGKIWHGPIRLVQGVYSEGQYPGRPEAYQIKMRWSARGRYLAYTTMQGGTRSALHVFDSISGEARQVASFDQEITQFWWSPGGKWIIAGLTEHPGEGITRKLWAVPLSDGATKRAAILDTFRMQEILGWLDEDRFIEYDGSLYRIVDEGAYNLRLVEINTGRVTELFPDSFLDAAFDPATGTVAVTTFYYQGDGLYMVSAADPVPRYLGVSPSFRVRWDDDLRLFITEDPCPEGEGRFRAYDTDGTPSCVQTPVPEPVFPSPDGAWTVTAKDGLWVEGSGMPRTQVRQATPSQVIWAPDSSGFFFATRHGLYRVSLPDLTVQRVVDLSMSELYFQWIEGE